MKTTQSLLFNFCPIEQPARASCSTCCSVSSGRGRPCDHLELPSSLFEYDYFHKGSALPITHQSGISQAAFLGSTIAVRLFFRLPLVVSRLVVLLNPEFENLQFSHPDLVFSISWNVAICCPVSGSALLGMFQVHLPILA